MTQLCVIGATSAYVVLFSSYCYWVYCRPKLDFQTSYRNDSDTKETVVSVRIYKKLWQHIESFSHSYWEHSETSLQCKKASCNAAIKIISLNCILFLKREEGVCVSVTLLSICSALPQQVCQRTAAFRHQPSPTLWDSSDKLKETTAHGIWCAESPHRSGSQINHKKAVSPLRGRI